jgi:hypothetical protein
MTNLEYFVDATKQYWEGTMPYHEGMEPFRHTVDLVSRTACHRHNIVVFAPHRDVLGVLNNLFDHLPEGVYEVFEGTHCLGTLHVTALKLVISDPWVKRYLLPEAHDWVVTQYHYANGALFSKTLDSMRMGRSTFKNFVHRVVSLSMQAQGEGYFKVESIKQDNL